MGGDRRGSGPTRQEVGPCCGRHRRNGPPVGVGRQRRWPAREDVLSVSSTLFVECGYYSVSMDDIAAAAGITRAPLYRYFNSNTKVLAELTSSALCHSSRLAARFVRARRQWPRHGFTRRVDATLCHVPLQIQWRHPGVV
nr:TetR/AcrR family transcriptional regulator [Mycobacterium marseillense]